MSGLGDVEVVGGIVARSNTVTISDTAPTFPTPKEKDVWLNTAVSAWLVFDGTSWVQMDSILTADEVLAIQGAYAPSAENTFVTENVLATHSHSQLHDPATVGTTATVAMAVNGQRISSTLITQQSVSSDEHGVKLSGDQETPGANKVYGTDSDGVRGWFAQPAGTDLSVAAHTASTLTLASSTGVGVTLPAADVDAAGMMSAAEHVKLTALPANATAAGVAGDAFATSHPLAFTHSLIATALQPGDIGVSVQPYAANLVDLANYEHTAFEPAGTAASTLAGHLVAFDHSRVATVFGWGDHAQAGYLKPAALASGAITPRTGTLDLQAIASASHAAVTLTDAAAGVLSLSGQSVGLASQAAGRVLIGPVSGDAAAPTMRTLAASDIPTLPAYAVAAKGVTGGDSHDHTGGDGAQIAYGSLGGLPTLGSASTHAASDFATAAQGTDARTPTPHKASHITGIDALAPVDIGAEPAQTKATQADAETRTGTAVLSWAPEQIGQAVSATLSSYAGNLTASSLSLNSPISSPAWGAAGIRVKNTSVVLTDTTSTGTVAFACSATWGGNTIAASHSVTFTAYATHVFNAPIAGDNVTITNPLVLQLNGDTQVNGKLIGATITQPKEVQYVVTLTGNYTVDLSLGARHCVTLDAARQITMPADPGAVAVSFELFINSNGYATTWGSSPVITWMTFDGLPPALSTVAGKVNALLFEWYSPGSAWLGYVKGIQA